MLSIAALVISFFVLSPADATPAQNHSAIQAIGNGEWLLSPLLMPALNERPPRPQVTDQTAYAGVRFTYQVPEVIDSDGDNLNYDAVQGAAYNPLPSWLTFDTSTRTFTGRQRPVHIDTYTIRVTVYDGQQTSWAEFTLTVAERPSNLPPMAAVLTAQTATEDQAFSYVVPEFSDPDGNTVAYAAALGDGGDLPGWLSFDATNRTLSGTPLEADTPASHTIRITATDDATPPLSSSTTFTLTVSEVNDAPVPVTDSASVVKGRSVVLSVTTLLANDTDPEGSTLSITAVGGAVNGTVSLSEDESEVTYTHDGSETTSGSFTYTVTDGTATATGTVAVSVTEPNNAPVAVDDEATVAEGGEVEIAAATLLSNDTDADDDGLSISGVGGAVNGTVALSEDKSKVTYTHDGSETTTGSFPYTVSDETDTATGTVTVTVTPVNDAPTGVADTATVAEGGEVEIAVTTLLANDSDPEGDSFTFTGVGSAVNGTVALSEDESEVTYTHDGSETTSGSFTYMVSDETATGTGTVTVTVTPVNDAPVPVNDTATVAEGGEVEIAVTTLLANDSDPEGSTLSVTGVGGAVNGAVVLSADKSEVTYTHDGSETTSGSFTYTVSDGTATATGTVVVTVTPVNDPPGALTLTDQTVTAGTSFSYEVPEVTDPDGDELTYAAFLGTGQNPLPGWLSFDEGTRTFSGTPRTAHVGEYEIQVTVNDSSAASKKAEFTLTVELPPNEAPEAPELTSQTATEDQAFSYEVPEFDDPEDDTITYAAALDGGGTLPGWLSFSATSRTLSGTPLEADTPASHTIRITATDAGSPSQSSSAMFSLTVTEVNDAPVPGNDSASVAEGGSVDVSVTTLLANDSDPEGSTLSVTGVGGGVNGTVAMSEDKSEVTYTHDGSETTTGSFPYTVSDETDTATGTVTVTVTPVNDAPTGVADTATVAEGGEVEIAVTTLLANDSDPEGDSFTFTGIGSAVNGTVALSEDESEVTYTHDGSETTSGSFTYMVSDETATGTGTVTVTVTPVNDAPVPVNDTATVAEGGEVEIAVTTLLANDSDPEGSTLSVTGVGGAVNGAVVLSADKSEVTYTHDGSETTSGSFTYTVSDGTATATGTVVVTVTPVNDPPGALTLTDQTVTAGTSFSYEVPEVTDPDGDELTYAAFLGTGQNPLPGWLSFDEGTRTFSGTPRTAHVGEYEIQVTVNDSSAASKKAEFTLTVELPPNEAPEAPELTSQTATEDQAFSYEVPEFDDPEDDTITYAAALDGGGTLPGWLSFNATSRTLGGTPLEADTPASHTIRITATDDGSPSKSSSATFSLTVAEVNDAPVPGNDTATVAEGGEVEIAVTTLLANDSDPEGNTLSITAVGGAVNGMVALSEDESEVTYTHDGSETTSGSFTYTVSDGTATATGTVTVTVMPANDGPVVVDDTATVAEGGEVEIAVTTMLANDTDPEGSTLSITAVGGAVNGGVALSEDESEVTYTHDGSETATGSFTYTVSDATATGTGTVTISVTPVNDAPVPVNDTATVAEGGSVDVAVTVLLANDTDPESGTLSVTGVGGAANGTVTLSEDESEVTYAHDGSETTTGSFTYTVSDGTAMATGTVAVTVTPVNDPPGALTLTDQTVTAGTSFSYEVPEVTDPDGDELTYAAFLGTGQNPLPGWLSFDEGTRTFSGTPRTAHVGEYEIQVTVNDSSAASKKAEFTLTVELPPNEAPEAPELTSQTATEDQAFSYEVPEFDDPEDDTITYAAALDGGGTLPGWLSFSATSRTLSGTPLEADTPASYTIRITATDDGSPSKSSSATFTLTAAEVDDAPVTVNDTAAVTEGGSVDVAVTTLLANDSDPEGSSLSVTAVGGALNGAVVQSEDKSKVTYTHDGSETTSGSFTYTVSDGTATATGTVSVTVTPANDGPAVVDDTATVAEGGSVDVSVTTLLANDSDPEGSTLSVTGVGGAVNGTVELSEDESEVTYAHDGSETTSGSFTYTVSDGTATATGMVVVTVTPANDGPVVVDDTATVAEGGGVDVAVTTLLANDSDPEGSTLSVTGVGGAVNGTVLLSEDESEVTYTHDGSETTSGSFTYTVSDGTATATGTVAVTVTPVNDPPGALTLKDQTATTETLFSYQVPEATDPDGDDLTYAAFLGTGQNPLPGWLSFDEETRTFSGTPQRVHAGEYEIQVTVTDSKAAAKKAEFTLTVVLPPNGAPEVPELTSQTATEDQAFSYVVPEFDDPEGDTVTYAAALDGGGTLPGWLGFNATSRTLSGTPQEDDTPGVLTIVVTATDDGDPPASAEVRFTLDVVEVNDAPTASAGEDQTVPGASLVTLDGSGSRDPEGESLGYAWSQDGEPQVAISGAATVAPTFVAPAQLPPDVELVFTLVVTDVAGAESEPDSVSLRVVGSVSPAEPVVPVISIEAEIASVVEGQVASFRIEAAPSPDRPIAIVMDVAGGDAYGVADGQRDVFILPGDTSSILVLHTVDDDRDEPHGRIEAVIRDQPLYSLGAKSTAHVIVSDNDLASSQLDLEITPEPTVPSLPTAALTPEPTSPPSPTAAPTPEPTSLPSPTAAPTPEPTSPPLPTAALTPEPTSPPSPTAAPTPEPTSLPSPTAAPTPEPTLPPSPTATRTPEPTQATSWQSDHLPSTSLPPSIATHAAMPTTPNLSLSWTPAPGQATLQPAGDPQPTASAWPTATAPSAPALSIQPPPVSTPTVEVEEPSATAAAVPVDDDQGAGRMGWIVTIALAGVTAATGGTVFLQGARR